MAIPMAPITISGTVELMEMRMESDSLGHKMDDKISGWRPTFPDHVHETRLVSVANTLYGTERPHTNRMHTYNVGLNIIKML